MAELCVPCRGRPRPLLHEDLLLSVATTLSTALQLLFDGSSWDVSHNPSNKWSRKYFRGQGRRFFFFFLLILCFYFFWWKIKTPTACVSWLHRLCRDKQLPRFITNTQTDFSISSFTPHIWTLLWYAKNVFSPKFFKQKVSDKCRCLLFLSFFWLSLLFHGIFWHTRVMRRVIKIPLNVNISLRRSSFRVWDHADRKAGETYFHAGPSSTHIL